MAISIQCPGCQSKLKLNQAPEKAIKLKCPKCEHVIGIKPNPEADADAAEAAAASPKVRKAAASAAGAGKKPASAKKKKKARPANDPWDDFEDDLGGGDDFGDDFEDDFEDDFAEPSGGRRRSSGGGARTAKGKAAKGKGKGKSKAKSGGSKGLVIGIIVGVLLIGGGVGAFMYFGGDDDDADTSGTMADTGDATGPAGGGGDAANAGGGGGGNNVANAGVDAAGQNAIDMSYMPADTELLIHARVSEIWNSPIVSKYKAAIPQEALGQLPPDAVESVTVGMSVAELMAAAAQAQAQAAAGFGGGPGGPPGFGGQGGPPGGGFGPPGFNPAAAQNYVVVARLTRSLSPQDLGATGTLDYNGTTLHKLVPPGSQAANPECLWFVDGQTAVIGKEANVKKSIDSGGRQARFARFDFVDKSNQVLIAFAPTNPDMLSGAPSGPKSGIPPLDSLQENITKGAKAVCLGLGVGSDVRLSLKLDCKSAQLASAIQTDANGAIQFGQQQLGQAIKSMGMMGLMLKPVEGIVGRATATASDTGVVVSLNATEQEIDALSKSVGPLIAGMGGLGGGPGGPPGAPLGFGTGGTGESTTPFGSETEDTVDFEKDVAPILKWRCGRCHIDDAKGQLSLASYDSLMAHEGKHGKAVVPGDPDASSFFKMTSEGKMPPQKKLRDKEIETIRLWIEAGAKPPGTAATVNRQASAPTTPTGNTLQGPDKDIPAPKPATVSFKNDVFPIFRQKCGGCHINARKGNLSLAQLSGFKNHAGKNGAVISPGNPDQSSLYTMIMTGKMPPRGQLSPQQTDAIRKWIAEGAQDN